MGFKKWPARDNNLSDIEDERRNVDIEQFFAAYFAKLFCIP